MFTKTVDGVTTTFGATKSPDTKLAELEYDLTNLIKSHAADDELIVKMRASVEFYSVGVAHPNAEPRERARMQCDLTIARDHIAILEPRLAWRAQQIEGLKREIARLGGAPVRIAGPAVMGALGGAP